LYLLAMSLFARFALLRKFQLQLPSITATFAVLIGYAIFSYVAIVLFIDYSHYNELRNGFDLKNRALDLMLFFLVFFYGAQTREDAILLMKVVLAAWVISHATAILDAAGVVHFGDMEIRSDGRVQGTLGESNQYGAFAALTLPAVTALAVASRGFARWMWGGAAVLTLATLLMTVSRGAFVGTTIACLAAAWMFRRYLSGPRLLQLALSIVAGLAVVGLIVGIWYGDLIRERLIDGLTPNDMAGTSSGRTEIWATAIEAMARQPWTFITGFGWNAYWALPFRYSPHNYYLAQWFNLGLIGLVCSIALIAIPIRRARAAAFAADPLIRAILVGFVVAALAYAVASFFVDLYEPWLYFWAYVGLTMRLTMLVEADTATAPAAVDRKEAPLAPTDPFGWVTAQRS
jgi:O-antigen ligase